MPLVPVLFAALVLANLAVWLGRMIRLPSVMSLIFVGILLGMPPISTGLIGENADAINWVGEIGLVFLLFLAGLETSWSFLKREKHDAFLIAAFGFITAFSFGFGVFRLLGFDNVVALIVGVSLAITAEGTTARVLLDLKKIKTRLGATMLGAGIVDDVIGIAAFVAVTIFFGGFSLGENALVFAAIVAFFTGLFSQKFLGREHRLVAGIENFLTVGVIPFFFISTGLHFDFGAIVFDGWILPLVIALAVVGKFLGVVLVKKFVQFDWSQMWLIGWAMNSRGAVELALALTALKMNLISAELYSSIVLMTFVTTLIFPFVADRAIRRRPKIMN